jgi:LPS-assembly lipoprotein
MQTAIRAVAGFALAALLAACGFHLRGDVTYAFATLQVTGPPQSPIVIELKRTLQSSGNVKLVEVPKDAQAILDVTNVSDDKGVLSLSGGGRVSEYVLTKRVSFNLHDIEGRDWMPAGEITVRRATRSASLKCWRASRRSSRCCATCKPTSSSRSSAGCRRRRSRSPEMNHPPGSLRSLPPRGGQSVPFGRPRGH